MSKIRNGKILKIGILIFSLMVATMMLGGCGDKAEKKVEKKHKLKVVTTIFPQYDFAKNVGGKNVNVEMLLKPGSESHSYEPSPKDIMKIQNADLFIYTGGENDDWVDDILESMGNKKPKTLKLVDCVKTVDEETVEGMEPEEDEDNDDDDHDKDDANDEEEHDVDEHVWTSPLNAMKISKRICKEFIKLDKDHKEDYEKNCKEYTKKLREIDEKIENIVKNSRHKTIIVGDRFPLRYFVDRYGLKYYAVFSGCSNETEADASTVAFIIDKVRKENIPVVFTIELSNGKIADTICEATGAKKMTFYSAHNVSEKQFKEGDTYIKMMERNAEALKEALK